ncbi:MAG: DUF4184 family protein [Promethearchaeota archaeon]
MPSSVLSHQAPALALKVKFPKKFDGTALCLGTFIPDLNFIFDLFFSTNFYVLTHSLIGQLLWTTPLAIILTLFFSRFIGPFFAKIASHKWKFYEPLRYFGIDQWKYLKYKNFSNKKLIKIVYSGFIGGLLHVLLDWPAHEYITLLYPWIVVLNFDFLLFSIIDFGTKSLGPFTFEVNLTIYNLFWFLETIIFLIISLYYLRYIKKHDLIQIWNEEEDYK